MRKVIGKYNLYVILFVLVLLLLGSYGRFQVTRAKNELLFQSRGAEARVALKKIKSSFDLSDMSEKNMTRLKGAIRFENSKLEYFQIVFKNSDDSSFEFDCRLFNRISCIYAISTYRCNNRRDIILIGDDLVFSRPRQCNYMSYIRWLYDLW